MAWLIQEDFKAIYVTDSATEVTPEQIQNCLDAAVDEIENRITPESFLVVSGDAGNALRPTKAMRRAQGKLAYAELLLIQSARYRSGDIVSTERDENNSVTNSYESFTQVEKRIEVLKSDAFAILTPFYTSAEASEAIRNYSSSVDIERVW